MIRIGAFVMLIASILSAHAQDKPPTDTEERKAAAAAADFLVLPLKVYRLKSAEVPEIDCRTLSDDDIRRVVAKANVIWSAAGIHWRLVSIEDIPAENTGRFRLVGIADDKFDDADPANKPVKDSLPHTIFRRVIPELTRSDANAYRVHYVHDFDVNGVYFGSREAMVKETAALRKVKDGVDEPLPRVTSHELGHALGLPHRQDTFNLMASGTTGTLLNAAEIDKAREFARRNQAVCTFESLKAEADKETDSNRKSDLQRSVRAIESLAGRPVHPVTEFDLGSILDRPKPESDTP